MPLDEAVRRVEPGKALQGNLDPAILLAPVGGRRAAGQARSSTAGRTAEGHVFNLGHGVLPETDPDVLARLTDLVHTVSARCGRQRPPGVLAGRPPGSDRAAAASRRRSGRRAA